MEWDLLDRTPRLFFDMIGSIDFDAYSSEQKIDWLLELIGRKPEPSIVLNFMKQISYEQDIDFLMADLADDYVVTNETLKLLADLTKSQCNPLSILQTILMSDRPILNLPTISRRLTEAYQTPELTSHQWASLYQIIVDQQVVKKVYPPEIISFIKYQIAAGLPPAPKPEWVTVGSETADMMELSFWSDKVQSQIGDVTHDILSQLIIPPSKETDDSIPVNPEDVIRRFLSIADDSSLSSLTGGIVSEWESKLNRIWGPANRILSRDCITAPGGRGPCRMLTCQCREYDELDEDDDTPPSFLEWWEFHDHRCQVCNLNIQQWFYALRQPVSNGGWVGCYCSFDCLEQEPARPIYDEDAVVLQIIKGQILSDGIADR